MIEKEKLLEPVVDMLNTNMGTKDGEKILIITDILETNQWEDFESKEIGDIIQRSLLAKTVYEIVREKFSNNPTELHVYPITGGHGVEPPEETSKKMEKSDIAIAITSYSLTHTDGREKATKAGTRVASMPMFLPDMLYPGGPMAANYEEIAKLCERFAERITDGEEASIKTPAGTDIKFSIEGRPGKCDDGILTSRGNWGNLPGGETFTAPVEGSAEGKVIVENEWFNDLEEEIIFHFEDGLVVSVDEGGKIGNEYRELLGFTAKEESEEVYEKRRNFAELGIGTNPNAKRPDNVLEAEKIKNTVHIAIGDNFHFGGEIKADLHQDFVLPKPTLVINGEEVIKGGKILIQNALTMNE